MDLEYIKRFIAVGQCLNFSKAAEMMFISQPTLSHSITCLEKELGTTLLTRNTKHVKLTPAGEIFLPAAIDIIDRYQSVANKLSQGFDPDDDVLNIGYSGPIIGSALPAWANEFRSLYPQIQVHFLRYHLTSIMQALQEHSIHFGVLYKMSAVNFPDLNFQGVGAEKFKVLLNSNHPLANQPRIDLAQLRNEPFLICERSCSPHYYDRVMSICERRGLAPNVSYRTALVKDIHQLVSSGFGVAIMSYSEERDRSLRDVKFIDIGDEDDLTNEVVMAWTDNLSEFARQFQEALNIR